VLVILVISVGLDLELPPRVFFVIVPVVVILVVPVVNADLNSGVLRFGRGHGYGRRNEDAGQKERNDAAMRNVHVEILR